MPIMKLRRRSEKNGNLLLGFSPWILAIACTLLLLLLALFTVSNYRREKELIGEALVQKGLTLMRFINSSGREAIRENLRNLKTWTPWEEQIQAAMEQAVEQPGVEYVLLIDSAGAILAGAGKDLPEERIDGETLSFARGLRPEGEKPFVARITRDARGDETKKKFQIVSWYLSPNMPQRLPDLLGRGPGRGQMMMGRFSRHPEFAKIQEEMEKLFEKHPLYIVQLDFEQFNTPLQRQLLQIVLLSVVILLVGIGGSLSFMTLRGLKGSQQRLGKMRAFNDILVSSLPVGLIATDSSGAIQVCNEAAAEILGGDRREILGKMPFVALPKGLAGMFSGRLAKETEQRQREFLLETNPEKSRVLQLASVVVQDDEQQFAGEVLLIGDLTEVKLLEKELQRSERLAALGKMAAGVAHELRNPLSSIKGLAVLLRSHFTASGREAETADMLVREVERLNRSIGELLDYAKPGQLARVPASIAEIVEKTVSLIRMDAEAYGISIDLSLGDDLPDMPVDKDKLNQVFLNLLLNAIQAMPDGGILAVRIERDERNAVVSIRDTGVGILPENLQRVFDPYYTTKNDGTGLGLAMSAKIVEEHGGTIKISSAPKEYTEVRVILPV